MSEDEQDRVETPGSWKSAANIADTDRWRALAVESGTDVRTMLAAGRELRRSLVGLDLLTTLRALSALAEGSHALARLVQADLEAVAVIEAAGVPVPDETLVLFPPESGAVRASAGAAGGWTLDGVQSRSVHPAAVGLALVVADTDLGERLFLFRMDATGVVRDRVPLRTLAPENPNGPVAFTAVPAEPVGTADWWGARRESFDGLLRDAACWFGACVWLCRAMEETLAGRTDDADLVRIGRVDVWVFSARLALRTAVGIVEPDPSSPVAELAARRAAAVAVTTADTVIRLVALLSDPRVSHEHELLPSRVAQLQIALQRFDADGNLARIGALVADSVVTPDPAA